jgi:CRP-like cAMP-binding protein
VYTTRFHNPCAIEWRNYADADIRHAVERSGVLRRHLVRHAQALLVQARQSAACNASHSVESRLSRLLSRARDLCGSEAFDGQAFDSQALPLTQELLAQMIGVRRNAVSIVAHAFQQAGLVNYSPGTDGNPGYRRLTTDVLRMSCGGPDAMRSAAERH